MGFVGLKPFDQMFSSYEFQAIVGVNYVNEGTNFEDYVKNTPVFDMESYDYNDHLAY